MKPILTYVAGKFTAKDRLKENAETLVGTGEYAILSTWLWTKDMENDLQVWQRHARNDLSQVTCCDLFILDTYDLSDTGGREVELGIALAKGKLIVRIGPKRNVFHTIFDYEFDTWEEFFDALNNKKTFSNKSMELRMRLNALKDRG